MPKLVLKDYSPVDVAFIRHSRKQGYTEAEIRCVLEDGNYLLTLHDAYEAFQAGFEYGVESGKTRILREVKTLLDLV